MYYHVWFVTKYRKEYLEGETNPRIKDIFSECIERHKYKVLEFETCYDHVHMLVEVNDRKELSETMRTLKAVSAKEILQTPRFRVGNVKSSFWARRYGSREIADSEIEYIREYIRNQKKHHGKDTTRGSV